MYGMNQNHAQAGDPSQLLPHVHLVSNYRFPRVPSLQPAQALEYLIKGPTIVKDTAAVAWTYFPAPPPDGTLFLTWQPPRMQNQFASDGLVWADAEVAYEIPIRGYNIQVLIHKSGFHYPHEAVTSHARYRYRITQGPGPIDPTLWVVHYTGADPASRIPASQIGIRPDVQQVLQQRATLENAGQLVRKEFMLADRTNWPRVEFQRGAAQPSPFYNPMNPMQQIPQRGAYPGQQPPNKRQRVNQPPRAPAQDLEQTLEEEENSTQDTFDFMTPREISLSRYKQHHEWMEEIFSSPHAVGKILPIDLGLGLMGELAPLTVDILDVSTGEHPPLNIERDSSGLDNRRKEYDVKSYNRLHPEQLKDFESRVADYTKKQEAELAKLKAAHEKKMADLKRNRTYIKAERRLRDIPRSRDYATAQEDADPVEDVVQELQKNIGVEFEPKKSVVCLDKGGLIEEQVLQKNQQVNGDDATPATNGNGSNGGADAIDAENSAAGLLDQYGSTSLAGTPGASLSVPALSQPPSQSQSAVATPSAPAPAAAPAVEPTNNDANELLDLDVDMPDMPSAPEGTADNDWVVVDPTTSTTTTTTAQQPASSSAGPSAPTATTTAPAASTTAPQQPSTDADPSAGIFDSTDFGSFDNLDTAGDALADYTNVDDNMGLDLVDDSAFGDAFHGTEMHHGGEGADGDAS
ncbi:DUF1750-domain-containing protein [Aaosphaeria arxii CBS 175.79]|uniref:DUF1750-domain-containing protein n=1 Tax=Aaosphaeria arxii CBS 175.79 TaxID=1450172 RepID=A0A6A5XII9_9PLEO|nr:DUF1750-domain-containing protein [Aaosphaeria arxii CBS 175.79]KAF2012124.1 DUF1750-domain-containing protein [Aaosphaeria arxii CBS 175.79]